MRPPDYGGLFCVLAERFSLSFEEIGERTWTQVRAMVRYMEKRPGAYTMLIEPKQ